MTDSVIQIRGARTHNLRDLDVDIPVGRVTVITGLSGSGKSSLAYDTLFAEGQRRYLESVSLQTHQMVRSLPRPDVDEVNGLPPTVSVDQRVGNVPARSTLAVTTEIYDYLRLLYARAGVVHCPTCGSSVQCQTIDEIVQRVLSFPDRSRFMLLAPLVRHRAGDHQEILDRIGRHGLVRVRIDGQLFDLSEVPDLHETEAHSIDAVVDRLILKKDVESRLRESIGLAVRESGDACVVSCQTDGNWTDHYFNTRPGCADCDVSFPELNPSMFSFRSGRGACSACEGLGVAGVVDDSENVTVFRQRPCKHCNGGRLQEFPSAVRLGGTTLPQWTSFTVAEAHRVTQRWQQELRDTESFECRAEGHAAAVRILPDIERLLASLMRVGLDYLTLDRPTRSLSGGEYQRARLASCLGTDVHGACYLLDEPSNGLHPSDTQRLLDNLFDLRDAGATLVLVEHDPDVIRSADQLIDIGPGAGADGGVLLYCGPPSEISSDSATGRVLADGMSDADTGTATAGLHGAGTLTVRGASMHNLQHVTVSLPLGQLVSVTGVSGSGKSSLIIQTLCPVAKTACSQAEHVRAALADAECEGVDGLENIDRLVVVDSGPVSRNRRSCLATHSGVWNDVRRLYARTREARAHGLTAAQFSFNSGGGRCSECKGSGIHDIRMNLLPDAEIPCSACAGQRFNNEVLSVRFGGRTLHDVLELRVDEALQAFSEIESTVRRLVPFQQVGLGYMTLGQPASTYSAGEAQRVQLAKELLEPVDGRVLYVMDEPTRGLHGADVARLLNVLRDLIARGHSVIVVEHNTQVIRHSDWVIDMGPGAAGCGGEVVAAGTPDELRSNQHSVTGQWIWTE